MKHELSLPVSFRSFRNFLDETKEIEKIFFMPFKYHTVISSGERCNENKRYGSFLLPSVIHKNCIFSYVLTNTQSLYIPI